MPLNDSPVPQTLYPKLPIEPENLSFEIDKGKEKIYLGVDLLDSKSSSEKRKLVCIVSHKEKLVVKKYDHEEFEKNANFQDNQVFINTDLVQLVLYVKRNEQKQCSEEIEKILKKSFDVSNKDKIYKIRGQFNNFWRNIREFSTYADMLSAYDVKTGNYIHHSLNHLGKIYLDTEKEYQKLNASKDVFSKEYSNIIKEMESILNKMKFIYEENRKDFQHLSTNTISPVEKSFEKLVSEFEKKVQQLEEAKNIAKNNDRMEVLENNTIKLQTDCKNVIPAGTACTEEIFNEKKKINDNINFLLTSIQDLKKSNVTNCAVGGLEDKYKTLAKELLEFQKKISLARNINNSEEEKLQHKQMETFFEERLQPILANVQNYAQETSPEKASVLKKIVEDFKNLHQKILGKANIKEINEIVTKIRDFIKDKLQVLVAPRGFFSTQGKSANLIQDLHSNLANLVSPDVKDTQACNLSNRL